MKYTQYFIHTRSRPDRSKISDEMIEGAIFSPVHSEIQSDGKIRKWGKIDDKFLRVILLEDGETVHNVFFDRNFKGG